MLSSWLTASPSAKAAAATIAPIVTRPEPPTPASTTLNGCSPASATAAGAGSTASHSAGGAIGGAIGGATGGAPAAPCARSIVMKLGQKPSVHDRSVLQVDWSIRRFRPKGVASGRTALQCDCSEQSPQPSQIRSWISTTGSAAKRVPRLRMRRFSVAQIWS